MVIDLWRVLTEIDKPVFVLCGVDQQRMGLSHWRLLH